MNKENTPRVRSTNMPSSAADHATGRDWLTMAVDPFNDGAPMVSPMPIPPESNVATQVFSRIFTITKPANLKEGEKWDCHIFTLPILSGPTLPSDFQALSLPDAFDEFATAYPAFQQGGVSFEFKEGIGGTTMPACGRPSTLNWVRVKSGYPTFPTGMSYDLMTGGFSGTTQQLYQRLISGAVLTDECDIIPSNTTSSYHSWNGVDALPPDQISPGFVVLDAGGYEVHNETPALYKSGGVTSYVMANVAADPVQWDHQDTKIFQGPFGEQHAVNLSVVRQPPATVEEAALIHGSVTWDAEDGVYQPFRLRPFEAHYQPTYNSSLALVRRDQMNYTVMHPTPATPLDPQYYQSKVVGWQQRTFTSSGYPVSNPLPGAIKTAAIETVGSFFTGLHENTILKLVVRFVVTTRPSPDNQVLTSFAKPPPPHDRRALDSYAETVALLPPAVPVNENPAGEFLALAKGAFASAEAGAASLSALASRVSGLTQQVQAMRLKTVSNKTPILKTKVDNAVLKNELAKIRQATKQVRREPTPAQKARVQMNQAAVGPRGKR